MSFKVCDKCRNHQLTGNTESPHKCLAGRNKELQEWFKAISDKKHKNDLHDLDCFQSPYEDFVI